MRIEEGLFAGNPNQHYMDTAAEFLKFINDNNRRNPVYFSHNGLTKDRKIITLRFVPFDFDNEAVLAGAYRDIRRLKEWSKKMGVQCLTNFSGSKGFHGFLEFIPVKAHVNEKLHDIYVGVQARAIEEAGLESYDRKVVGDHQRILRVPDTLHTKTNLYCVEVPEQILNDSLEAVLRYAKQPRGPVDVPEPTETLPEWMKRTGTRPRTTVQYAQGTPTIDYVGGDDDFVKQLLPRMCIHNAMCSHNPPHMVRQEAVSTMLQAGLPKDFIVNFFLETGARHGWTRSDRGKTSYQVSHIAKQHGGTGYDLHSCASLRANGLCVGKACPTFSKVFKD